MTASQSETDAAKTDRSFGIDGKALRAELRKNIIDWPGRHWKAQIGSPEEKQLRAQAAALRRRRP